MLIKNNSKYNHINSTISIIIPAYNVELYITDSLDSIAKQTIPPDEIIIINDGSTDRTSSIIKKHPLYARIKLIEVDNGGQGLARNIGIAEATSDYIYFFDSDDLLVSNFIASIKQLIINNKYPDLLLFSGKSFNDSNYTNSNFNPNYIRPFEGIYTDQKTLLHDLMLYPELSCSPCLYISKRKLWNENKLRFNSFYHEDEEIFYPLIFSASSYIVSKERFFLRRIRPNSTMTKTKVEKHELGQRAVLISLLDLLNKNKFSKLKSYLIRQRLNTFIFSYLYTSQQVSNNPNYKLILKSTIKSQGIKTPLRLLKMMTANRLKKFIYKHD